MCCKISEQRIGRITIAGKESRRKSEWADAPFAATPAKKLYIRMKIEHLSWEYWSYVFKSTTANIRLVFKFTGIGAVPVWLANLRVEGMPVICKLLSLDALPWNSLWWEYEPFLWNEQLDTV